MPTRRSERLTGISAEWEAYLLQRSQAFARATQGRDAPGKSDHYCKSKRGES